MSFISKLKRSLGFGPDDEVEYDSIYEDTAAAVETPASETDAAEMSQEHPQVKPVDFDADMQNLIFAKVVEVFNNAMPDFISKATDQEMQRRILFDSLDAGVKDYLKSISTAAEAYCDAQWKARQNSMAAELDAIKHRAGEIEKQSSDIKQKQLSADRQKRALTERVHDLESQLAKLESEREQFELENRSLVNRIKVANVQQEDLEKAQADIHALTLELNAIRNNPESAFAEREEKLNKQIAEMTDGIDSLKEQLRVSEEMREDLKKRYEEKLDSQKQALSVENEELKKKISKLEVSLTTIDNLRKDLAAKTVEVNDLNEMIKDYDELNSRMGEVDKAMTRLNDKILSQKKIIGQRDAEIDTLKATIAENKRIQAERVKSLKAEIDALRPPTVVAEMQVDFGSVTEDSAPRISEDDLSAMEETFESGEWFTKTPPPPTPSMRPPEADAEFGYRAPRRKSPQITNPDQLSLF